MELIFFDTEFTELGIDPHLISIGLISADGTRTFYAELLNTYDLNQCSDFAREAVLPLLEGATALMSMSKLEEKLKTWIESFNQPIQLATDSIAWDWPWIAEIFNENGSWPVNLHEQPFLIKKDLTFNLACEKAFTGGLRRHHALDDAIANRQGYISANNDRYLN